VLSARLSSPGRLRGLDIGGIDQEIVDLDVQGVGNQSHGEKPGLDDAA
jgi:hypothetical protein